MTSALSPAKIVLLAAHYTAHADIESLSRLAGQRALVLHKELLLRILITFLPETLEPSAYVGLLRNIANESLPQHHGDSLDTLSVEELSDEEASRRVKKLRLLRLPSPDAPDDSQDDLLGSFLVQRACRIDQGAGPVSQLPDLLLPFLSHVPRIRPWVASTVVPYIRRNFEYYAPVDPMYSLLDFQNLPDRTAITYLLSLTGRHETGHLQFIGRDLGGLVGPWIQDQTRWRTNGTGPEDASIHAASGVYCPGWEQVLEWLISQPPDSGMMAAAAAVEQWAGPWEMKSEPGEGGSLSLTEPQQRYLESSYARAGFASSYLLSEATVETLTSAYRITSKLRSLLGFGSDSTIDTAASLLPNMSHLDMKPFSSGRTAVYMRNGLLQQDNPLTTPTETATQFLLTLITSAFITTRLGLPLTVKGAGDLAILQDRRDQEAQLKQLIRAAQNHTRGPEDEYWIRVRREILWLRDWATRDDSNKNTSETPKGIFGALPRELIESHILKTLLSKSCCALARTIYEDGGEQPLPPSTIREVAYEAALQAFDNATNPNRSRGGLKKCDAIIHAFPKTMDSSHAFTKRVEALLRCTHALSDYRLVLKQGEPFSPVLLRVHSDPISIVGKVLEQNLKAYTRLQEFLEMASNMVYAGIPSSAHKRQESRCSSDVVGSRLATAEKRVVAMCIEAALREDDFETAYSYVVSRLDASSSRDDEDDEHDEWSWSAALKAGQYVRSGRTLGPTHLGTASGNLEVRHLEQRMECLATALRVAPASQLQEILKTFRRCEEQLDSAIKADEASQQAAWEAPGKAIPGGFEEAPFAASSSSSSSPSLSLPRNTAATTAARRTDNAPMSLFDLSRATARMASRNLTSFPGLPSAMTTSPQASQPRSEDPDQAGQHQHMRKRDQLREAATGTLVSGVGWLIGANPK